MACPYFRPETPLRRGPGPNGSMLPLGDEWTGTCHAEPEAIHTPEPDTARRCCNLGYARGTCSRFPGGGEPDAVRFAIRAARDGALHLYYVVERDHHPWAHGAMEYSTAEARLTGYSGPDLLRWQAEAYARSYLYRKEEADGREHGG